MPPWWPASSSVRRQILWTAWANVRFVEVVSSDQVALEARVRYLQSRPLQAPAHSVPGRHRPAHKFGGSGSGYNMEPEMLRLPNMPRLPLGFLVLGLAWSAADQRSNDVHAVVDRLLTRYGTDQGPGCAAGVLLKGKVVFEGAAGTMDGHQPLSASTPMFWLPFQSNSQPRQSTSSSMAARSAWISQSGQLSRSYQRTQQALRFFSY